MFVCFFFLFFFYEYFVVLIDYTADASLKDELKMKESDDFKAVTWFIGLWH